VACSALQSAVDVFVLASGDCTSEAQKRGRASATSSDNSGDHTGHAQRGLSIFDERQPRATNNRARRGGASHNSAPPIPMNTERCI
jgi:hypothetical protein